MTQKILIVDDSSTARALFRVCFEEHPEFEIIQASTWQDALLKAEEHQPFMIVLDYNMPEKSGAGLAKMLQDKGIKAHYVLITANTQQSILDEVQKLGFFHIIEKPITAEHVESLLDKLR